MTGRLIYDVDAPSSLVDMLDRSVRDYPDRTAIVDDSYRVSYSELNAYVDILAARLSFLGVRPDARVALLSGSGLAFTAAAWAVWKLGANLVPLNWRLTATDLAAQIADSQSEFVLVGRTRVDLGRQLEGLTDSTFVFQSDDEPTFLEGAESSTFDVAVGEDTPAAMLYTSGTTGRPKGVVISHGSAVQNSITATEVIGRRHEDVELVLAPQFNVTGLCSQTVPAVHLGMTMVLPDTFDAKQAVRLIDEHEVSVAVGAPTMWWRILEAADEESLTSLRLALYGGAPMPRALQDLMRTRLPQASFGNGYGMTETTSMVSYIGGDAAIDRPESVGKPLPITEMRLVSGEDGSDVPEGDVGEVVVRGPQIALGYWRDSEIVPIVDSEGWLRTGDAARMVDGYIVLADRLKDVIKRSGESVFSIEVEEVLYQHPDIFEASVVGVPDERMGERVLAVVALKDERVLEEEDVKSFCRESLANFKVPSYVMFRDALPRNAGGKVIKEQLRKEFSVSAGE